MFFPIIWVLRVVIWWPLLYCWVVRRTPRFIFTLSVRFQRKRRTVLVRHNAFGRSPSSLDLLLSCYWSSKGRVRRSDVSRSPPMLQQLSLSVRYGAMLMLLLLFAHDAQLLLLIPHYICILANVMKSEKGLKTLNYENEFLKHFLGNWHWMNLLFTNYLGINQGDPNQKLLIEMAIYAFLTPSWYNQNTFQSSTFILIFHVFVKNFQLFVSNFQLCVYNLQNKCTPLKRIFT